MQKMTREEIYSIAEQTRVYTKYPAVKKIMTNVVNMLSDTCPGCGSYIYDNCRLVYVRENRLKDMVTYICSNCGTVFRKYELKGDDEAS